MAKATTFEIDYMAAHLEEVRKHLLEQGIESITQLQLERAHLMEGLPNSWKEALSGVRGHLWSPPLGNKGLSSAFSDESDWKVRFNYVRGGIAERESRVDDLDHMASDHADKMRAALTEWPKQTRAFHKDRLVFKGAPHLSWSMEFPLVGELGRWGNSTPFAACRMRLTALFPMSEKPALPTQRIPRVRIEMLEAVGIWSEPGIRNSFVGILMKMAEDVCQNVGYAIHCASDDEEESLKMTLQVAFPDGMEDYAKEFIDRCRDEKEGCNPLGDWYGCSNFELQRLEVRTPVDPEQPMKNEKRQVKRNSLPSGAGERFLLIEFPLKDVTLLRDGAVCPAHLAESARTYAEEVGQSAAAVLEIACIDLEMLASMDYRQVMCDLSRRAIVLDVDESVLIEAVQLMGIGGPAPRQLRMCALIDISTGHQRVGVFEGETEMVSFLDTALRGPGRIHAVAEGYSIRASKKIAKEFPEIAEWARSHGARIEHPESGFDAGAVQVRQWLKLARDSFHVDRRGWWERQGETVSLDTFSQRIFDTCRIINHEPIENPDNSRIAFSIGHAMFSHEPGERGVSTLRRSMGK